MLGVTTNPTMTPSDDVMKQVADEMGVGGHVPSYAGRSPLRRRRRRGRQHGGRPVLRWRRTRTRKTCIECGECMTGCRHHAKNTLTKNYLHLAEQAGARVHPLTTVTEVRPLPGGGYAIATRPTAARSRRARSAGRTFTAEQVILAASALGTQRLLHRMRDEAVLPGLSPRLGLPDPDQLRGRSSGRSLRTVSADFTRGVAITSSFHPDADTHIEPVRYGKGSNAMSLLQTVLTDGDGRGRPMADLAEGDVAGEAAGPPALRLPALVRAHGDRAWSCRRSTTRSRRTPSDPTHRASAVDVAAGSRDPEPDLDPGRQRRRTPDGADRERHRGRVHRRALQLGR